MTGVGQWLSHPLATILPADPRCHRRQCRFQDNERLIEQWPHGKIAGVPVWHLHEPLDHLSKLACLWPRSLPAGSSADFAMSRYPAVVESNG